MRLRQLIEECRLALVMSGVVFALILYIFLYDVGRCVLTDGVCIIAFAPEFPSPQHPFDFGMSFEYLFCSNALDGLHDRSRRCCGDRLDHEVDMILVGADLDEVDIISVLYFKADVFECLDDTVGQNFPPVLHRAYEVVQERGFVVPLGPVTVLHARNIHLTSLPPKQSFGAIVLVYEASVFFEACRDFNMRETAHPHPGQD